MKNSWSSSFLKILFVSVRTLIVVILLLTSVLQVGFVQRFLLNEVNDMLERDGQRIEIIGLKGFFPFQVYWKKISYVQNEKPIVEVNDGHLAWNPFKLIYNKLDIKRFTTKYVSVDLPSTGNSKNVLKSHENDQSNGGFFFIPFSLGEVKINVIDLKPSVLGVSKKLTLSLHEVERKGRCTYSFNLDDINTEQKLRLTAEFQPEKNFLKLSGKGLLNEKELLSRLSVDVNKPIKLNLNGKGTPSAWDSSFHLVGAGYQSNINLKSELIKQGKEEPDYYISYTLNGSLRDAKEEIFFLNGVGTAKKQTPTYIEIKSLNLNTQQFKADLGGFIDVPSALTVLDFTVEPTKNFFNDLPAVKKMNLGGNIRISNQAITFSSKNGAIQYEDYIAHPNLTSRFNYKVLAGDIDFRTKLTHVTQQDRPLGNVHVAANYVRGLITGNLKAKSVDLKPLTSNELATGTELHVDFRGPVNKLEGSVTAQGKWGDFTYNSQRFGFFDKDQIALNLTLPDQEKMVVNSFFSQKDSQYFLENLRVDQFLALEIEKLGLSWKTEGETFIANPTIFLKVNNTPVSVGGAVTYANNNIDAKSIKIESQKNNILLNGSYNVEKNIFSGRGVAALNDLGQIEDAFGMPDLKLRGALKADIDFLHNANTSTASINIQGQKLNLGQGFLYKLNSTTKIDNLFNPSITSTMNLHDGRLGNIDLYDGKLESKFAANKLSFTSALRGNNNYGVAVNLAGNMFFEDVIKLTLEKLKASFGKEKIRIDQPFSINLAPKNTFKGEKIFLSDGFVALNGSIDEKTANLQLTLKDVTNEAITNVLGYVDKVRGEISGEVNINGPLGAPIIDSKLRIESVRGNDTWLNSMGIRYEANKLASEMSFNNKDLSFDASVNLPVEFSLAPFVFNMHDDKQSSINLDIDGDLNVINKVFTLYEDRLVGSIKGNLLLEGPMKSLQHTADLRLNNVAYKNLNIGLELKDINTHLSAKKSDFIKIAPFKARDPKGKELDVNGNFKFMNNFTPFIDVTAETKDLRVVHEENIGGTTAGFFTGKAAIKGPVNALNIYARGDLGPYTQYLGGASTKTYSQVPYISKNDLNKAIDDSARTTQENGKFDVHIKTKGDIRVYGQGLESLWGGDITLKGSLDEPEVGGALKLLRGSYVLTGKELELAQGVVKFTGSMDPLLEIRAQYEMGDAVAYFDINGYASNIKVNIYSIPELQQEQILSRFLFGKEKESITPGQAIKLSLAAVSLGGSGGGQFSGLMDRINSFINVGVEEVEDPITKDKRSVLEVSKDLTKKIYLRGEFQGAVPSLAGGGQDEKSSRFIGGYRLNEKVSVEGDVSTKSKVGVGLKFRTKYD